MSSFTANRTEFDEEIDRDDRANDTAMKHREGKIAKTIEDQTAKLPSDLFLWAAGAAIVGSWALQCAGKEHASLFVGQWVAPTLIVGLYNKLVKVAGSDQAENADATRQ